MVPCVLSFKLLNVKVTVHHFRIGGCLDGWKFLSLVLDFISPRCLEIVGISKSEYFYSFIFGVSNSSFFLNALSFRMKIYSNKYLTRLQTFSVKESTSKRSWLVYNPFLTVLNKQINVNTTFIYNQLFQIGQIVPFSNGKPSCVLKQQIIIICCLKMLEHNGPPPQEGGGTAFD